MAELHFMRPWWLLAFPVGAFLIWRLLGGPRVKGNWPSVIDEALQPFVLSAARAAGTRLWPMVLALAALAVAVVALAGPAWERLPVPAFRSSEALVVVVDLSRSMDAGDVEPSRLARARLKLLSLLERRQGGQTALVVFSAHAFTVTPLTTDNRTIASLVNALSTDIMPSRGSFPEAGLEKAAELLRQTGSSEGEILLVTDSTPSAAALSVAAELRREGFVTHVLGVGTGEGAPIPELEGGFMTDRAGQVVVPRLDERALERLADAGRGRFATLTSTDRDLDRLFPDGPVSEAAGVDDDGQEYEADVWRDEGIWLALLLLPLIALGFRRGWVYVCLAWVALPATEAEAFEWRDLWQRPDQQGFEALEQDQAARAAGLFEDDEWRAAAQYRAENYAESAGSLSGIDTPDGHYNRGNALARAGDLEGAISAYDRAIELEPDHEDAIYNRELVAELLEQQQQQQQENQEGQEGQQGESQENPGDEGQQQQQSAQNDPSEQGEQGEEQGQESQNESSNDPSDDQRQASDDSSTDDSGSDPDEPRDAEGEDAGEAEDQRQASAAAAAPEDIEEWASEQAADQWLRRIPQDPGGLLRRKFRYQYQRLGIDQDGNYVWPGDEERPW